MINQWGGTGKVDSFAVDLFPSGRYVVSAIYENTTNFNGTSLTSQGMYDVATLFYDGGNNIYAVETYGGPNNEVARSGAADPNGCNTMAYQTGEFQSSPLEAGGSTLINHGPTSTSDIFVVGTEVRSPDSDA